MQDEIWKDAVDLVWPAIIKGIVFYGTGLIVGFGMGPTLQTTAAVFAGVDILRRGIGPEISQFIPEFSSSDPYVKSNPLNPLAVKIPWELFFKSYLTQALSFALALYALPALGFSVALVNNIPVAFLLSILTSYLTTLIGAYAPCILKPGSSCSTGPKQNLTTGTNFIGKHTYTRLLK